jgi:hypothetical protein
MRQLLGLVVVTALALAGIAPLHAQSLDAASSAALDATLRMLQDPTQRNAAIGRSPEATTTDRQLQSMLSSPELQQEFYALAADIFADLVQTAGGDVSKISQALEAGRTDPAAFIGRLSPQTREKLRAFSAKVGEKR